MMKSIYIVDDDDSVRSSLYELVRSFSNTIVRSFKSGDDFLESLPELDPGLVLLDLNMPGTNGMEVFAQTKDHPDLTFVILTGQGDIQKAVKAIKAGAVDFIEKPFRPDELLRIVQTGLSDLEDSRKEHQKVDNAKALIDRLSPRERDVMNGLLDGCSNRSIAEAHKISPRTVEIHRANMMEKLEAQHVSDVLRIAYSAGAIAA
ncbi:response regulator transcription factor [Erythrobacter aureus]|uniref:DNA-binding response regulator n=1 Tax=Erythrobacter aureus TaxID=2182384 RepID=A0A345YIG2_9SPHN|nr:response regulator [Erythrobacter aureus]AXK43714.1 DNA-binding response regulator [Erythrobacter aureus]